MPGEATVKHPGFMGYKAKDFLFTENLEARWMQLHF